MSVWRPELTSEQIGRAGDAADLLEEYEYNPLLDGASRLSPHSDLIRAVNLVCDDLDARLYPAVGVIRQLVRVAATLPAPPAQDVCPAPGCSTRITQPGRGRPRLYCSTRCKSRASKQRARNVAQMLE